MAKTDFGSVDDYLARQPEAVRKILQRVRGAIRRALPDAEECISYQIPAYKLHGAVVLYFAGWKEHYSLYPATSPLVEAFADELAGYSLSKGTIRFPLSQPVPVTLVERIARFRAKETRARQQAKTRASAPSRPAARKSRRVGRPG